MNKSDFLSATVLDHGLNPGVVDLAQGDIKSWGSCWKSQSTLSNSENGRSESSNFHDALRFALVMLMWTFMLPDMLGHPQIYVYRHDTEALEIMSTAWSSENDQTGGYTVSSLQGLTRKVRPRLFEDISIAFYPPYNHSRSLTEASLLARWNAEGDGLGWARRPLYSSSSVRESSHFVPLSPAANVALYY